MRAKHMRAAGLLQHLLEVAQELGQAVVAQILGALGCLGFLVFVIQAGGDRMMAVVHLGHQVGDGQLQLQCLDALCVRVRHQLQLRSDDMQDRRNLRNHRVAGLEEGRRERLRAGLVAFQKGIHHLIAFDTRHVGVVGAGVFQCEPDEFAAALQAGPVVELIVHALLRDRWRYSVETAWLGGRDRSVSRL
ncbi:hypothetical protein XPU_2057 [Xanthomonas arboricola pv. pruni str. MAFF 311562]|uniref:Uncharacterized protein n=1 Tax=Xanthomonas arboricola pv. pruni str. MAFF 311562 TaxID=1414836 RepID=W4S1P4_9XANT|nr:hypothetical protein XPU_2057 [Xanthomonas arboricola pv. pruni str. MAFF 311562]